MPDVQCSSGLGRLGQGQWSARPHPDLLPRGEGTAAGRSGCASGWGATYSVGGKLDRWTRRRRRGANAGLDDSIPPGLGEWTSTSINARKDRGNLSLRRGSIQFANGLNPTVRLERALWRMENRATHRRP
jgi:hypothetical protein